MKYYLAFEDYYDFNDADFYALEDICETGNMYIGGNSAFKSINAELIDGLKARLEDIRYSVEYEKDDNTSYAEIVNQFITFVDGGELTEDESKTIAELAIAFYACKSYEENDIYCKVLEIIYGKPFTCGTFHGCVQREWADYICPADVDKDTLEYCEAIFFGLCQYYSVTSQPVELPDDVAEDKLADFVTIDFDQFDQIVYVYGWKSPAEVIAKELGIDPEKIKFI